MMSIEHYELAKSLAKEHSDVIRYMGPASQRLILAAEEVLQLTFPPLYRRFLAEFRYLWCGGIEIYGITSENFIKATVPNAVWLTKEERSKGHLPAHLILIQFLDDGEYAALDTRFSYDPDQCPVIVCAPGVYDLPNKPEKLADDFGQFLLDQVKEALARCGRLH